MSIYLGNQKVSPLIVVKENKLGKFIDGSLTEITADDLVGVTKISKNAFYKNGSVISITIPNSITSIGDEAFSNCRIAYVIIQSGLTIIGHYAFRECSYLKNIELPNSLTSIGMYAFSNCSALESIELPNSLTSIGGSAFQGCKFKNIVIPNKITSIEASTFLGCQNLTTVVIQGSVKSIGYAAFYNCAKLISITIPNTVTTLESRALEIGNSTNKATITFKSTTPPTIASSTFNASYLEKIIVPNGSGESYKTATNWSAFADYIEEATE